MTIMQIHGSTDAAVALMLRVYDGKLRHVTGTVLDDAVYDRWLKYNVIYDVGANKVSVFIDDVLKLVAPGGAPNTYYFKCGVYGTGHDSHYMESRWKGISVLKKD